MSNRFIQNPWLSDVLTTTDATPTVSGPTSFTIPSGSQGYVEMVVNARITSTNVGGVAKLARPFQNPSGTLALVGAGLITIVGTAGALVGDATITTAVGTFVVSGNIIQPRVTGIIATNIEWLLDVRYWLN
jgi:hypothetical protein